MNLHNLGGRRFLLTIGCGIVTSLLTFLDKLDGATYATVTIATVGAFIAGNVVSEVKGKPDDR